MYMMIKHSHITIIVLTYVLFLINFVLLMKGSDAAKNKILKVGPHILYTLFIITFIYLSWVNPLNLYPFAHSWATTKLAGFVFYILSIALALTWAKSTLWRVVGFISATFWLIMTARLGFADRLKVKVAEEDVNAMLNATSEWISSLV